MAKKFREKLRRMSPFSHQASPADLPQPLPADPDQRLVKVYVEGYEDVAFWRGIFDHFHNPYLRFEISVPDRGDLPKGKKVLMGMIPQSSEEMILCVDSDFDYLFAGQTEQSRQVADARFMFHTYAYATENYLCYAPSLHNVCVKATKNDTRPRCAWATSKSETTANGPWSGSAATLRNARSCSGAAIRG